MSITNMDSLFKKLTSIDQQEVYDRALELSSARKVGKSGKSLPDSRPDVKVRTTTEVSGNLGDLLTPEIVQIALGKHTELVGDEEVELRIWLDRDIEAGETVNLDHLLRGSFIATLKTPDIGLLPPTSKKDLE